MKEKKAPVCQGSRYFFYILMLAILGWFLYMQIFGTDERTPDTNSGSVLYSGTFTWQKADGTSEEITVPGDYNLPAGQTMVITTILPLDFNETSFAIRSSLQDVDFYVGGELRERYNTHDTRLVGKNSASRYVFCPVSSEDAGKELRIELTTYTTNYSGIVNSVYCGNKADIWQAIFNQFGLPTYIAFFILFAGLITISFSFALGAIYHTRFDMEYLGWCMVMGAIWMLGESKIRQLLVPNASSLGSLCFVMIMLCPIPLLLYADSVQQGLHRRLYRYIGGIAVLNFVVCTSLTALGIADYIETLPVAHIILTVTFLTIFIHLCLYIRTSQSRTDHLLLLGLLLALLCVAVEMISAYFVPVLSGIFIGIGMLILFFVNIIRTSSHVQDMELQRQKQELLEKQKQTEKMSLQMMQTLATTIEAKDEYTRGHSHRVAEYSALIAKELGWAPEDVEHIRHATYLHDIGKIGIPDQILNKPSRLTDEEYNLIKRHTVIGAEILKDVTLIPHVIEIARNHHERFDGKGYPDGLTGTDIPLHARIVAVADSYDAMNSRRIYRNALPIEMIREEISKNRGTQFDPEIADVFLKLLNENRLSQIDSSANASSAETVTLSQPELEHTINKFISDVVTTIKSQEDTKSYDFLTGLPMRSLGERLIAELMQKHNGCLIFLDMDNLKKINDIHGHKAGDRALKNLGNLLSRYATDGIACRLGGDEFLLFLPDVTAASVSEIMTGLFKQFHSIAEADPEIRYAALSAGLYMCTISDTFADCYSKADKALYYVKQNGKNQFSFYQQISYQKPDAPGIGKDLRQVANTLRESGNYSGALDLSYRDFSRQYEYMRQLIVRSNCHCYLVMVTMETTVDTLPHIEEIEQALSQMEQAIRKTIRRVDICTRYSAMQYLIILFEPMETEIPNIMERIFMQYYKQTENYDFHPGYEYLTMSENGDTPTGNEMADTK
ncbi:bifunctional diguanylate cyclase/phosphohydrolase [Blautia sp. HCP3S3_H10_1]|uniref:bifunctional diguanylate cyclase/phosphohydrolase n=1 Tax=unclassified Blautia TaxID=2648079 RepID=UPI003F900F6D